MHWYGAGGPAYYLEDGGRVTAILFWSDANVAQGVDGDFSVRSAGRSSTTWVSAYATRC